MVRASDLRLNGREFDPGRRTIGHIGRLILGWVTISGGGGIPSRYVTKPTQPPTFCGTVNEYRPKGGDALRRLKNKGRMAYSIPE